jgi:hypothetical protein
MQPCNKTLTHPWIGKIVLGTYKIMVGKIVLGTYKIMMGKNCARHLQNYDGQHYDGHLQNYDGHLQIYDGHLQIYDGHLQDAGNAQICAGYLKMLDSVSFF